MIFSPNFNYLSCDTADVALLFYPVDLLIPRQVSCATCIILRFVHDQFWL